MSAFTSRSGGYKGGIFLLFFAFVVFLVGYASPFWASYSSGGDGHYEGIWMACYSYSSGYLSSTGCSTYGFSQPGWFHAVRALEAICLALLIIACIYALASNCCRAFPGPRTRVLEILSSIGGVLGLVGVIVYGAMRNDSNRSYVIIEMTIDWALYLTGVGSGLAVVAAVIIGITNKEISQPTTGAVIGMTTVTSTAQHTAGQPAYPAHQPGYPAPQPGYPAHQPGYPAHYGDYPGSGGGYPPPQAGYGYPGKY